MALVGDRGLLSAPKLHSFRAALPEAWFGLRRRELGGVMVDDVVVDPYLLPGVAFAGLTADWFLYSDEKGELYLAHVEFARLGFVVLGWN